MVEGGIAEVEVGEGEGSSVGAVRMVAGIVEPPNVKSVPSGILGPRYVSGR